MKPRYAWFRHPACTRGFDTGWRILNHEAVYRRGRQTCSGQEEEIGCVLWV